MPVKVTLEYDELPQELSALEQHHNAGAPAHEVGYTAAEVEGGEPVAELSGDQLAHQVKHPEDFQLHNAGRPAVVTGGGNQLSTPQEWDPDLENH